LKDAQRYALQLISSPNIKMDTLIEDLVHLIVSGEHQIDLRLTWYQAFSPSVCLSVRLPYVLARLPVEIFR